MSNLQNLLIIQLNLSQIFERNKDRFLPTVSRDVFFDRTILKRRIRVKGLTVDTSRSTPSEFTRGNAASVICRRLRHLFYLDPAGPTVGAHRRRCISAVAFPRYACSHRGIVGAMKIHGCTRLPDAVCIMRQ